MFKPEGRIGTRHGPSRAAPLLREPLPEAFVCGLLAQWVELRDQRTLVRTTDEGVEFVRTPSGCFQDLPGFPHELKSVDIDGLRQGYVDEGPADAPVVLLLHGQPTWAFLYRKMIPVLVDAGYRAIAMDHLGMGYSDKPIDIADYSYLGHIDRLEKFIEALGLRDIPDEDEAAYDAPFPSRIYMAGPRVFPSLVNELGGVNQDAWAGLTQFQKPFLTVWASNDPATSAPARPKTA